MNGSLQIKNNRYYMVIELGKGKQKWKSTGLTVRGNKRNAEKMLKDYLFEYEQELAKKPKDDIQMDDLINEWLKIKKCEVRINTFNSYKETADIHVIPYFKEFTASQVTTAIIKKYYNEKFIAGMSPETLTRHRTILRGSLDYAIEVLDIIEVNSADRASLPKSTAKRTPTYYDVEQLKTLFQEVEGQSIEAPVRISATYGLRRSEVLGLKWSAIDFERRTITISHTVVRGGLLVVSDDMVKENASYRTMPLTNDIELFLLKLKQTQTEHKKLCGKSYHKGNYICVWEDGKPLDPAYVTSRFRRFLKEKKLPLIRFHDLRHSSASLLVNNGFTLEEVMKWLGHASIRSTERYAHLQKHDKEDMASAVDGLLSL